MKDDESRQLMVKRVNETYEKWPHFIALPEVKEDDGVLKSELPGTGLEPHHYISALYAVCANGEVIGRFGNKVIGKFLNIGTSALQEAIAPKPGRRMKADPR